MYEAALTGNESAEKRLFQTLAVRFRLLVSHDIWSTDDIDDIVQDALVTVSEKFRGIQIERSFAAWANQVLDYVIKNHWRKRKMKEKTFHITEDIGALGQTWSPNPSMERALSFCLKELARTNRRFARTLSLNYQGFGTDEICDRLGINSANLYVIVSRARSLLKACLERKGVL